MEVVSNEEKISNVENNDEPMDVQDSNVNSIGDSVNNEENGDTNELKIKSKTFENDLKSNESEDVNISNASEGDLNTKSLKDDNNASKAAVNSEIEVVNNLNEDLKNNAQNVVNVSANDVLKDNCIDDTNSQSKNVETLDSTNDTNHKSENQEESFQTAESEEETKQQEETVNQNTDSSENVVISSQKLEENVTKTSDSTDIAIEEPVMGQNSSIADDIEVENPTLVSDTIMTREPAASYLEDFLFTSGSRSSGKQDSDSTSCDEKGLPLRKFPQIVKGVESADYEVLQALYLILYLRNAWDTESILVQRILDFSGFDCEPDSEDFYTRKLNLCTMSDELLNKIKALLQVPALWPAMATSEEAKLDAVQRILVFLQKPKKRRRRRNASTERKKTSAGKGRGRPAKSKDKNVSNSSFSGIDLSYLNTDTNLTNTSFTSQDISESNDSTDVDKSDKVGLYVYKPGPLSFKLKASGLSESEIIEIEKSLKEKLSKGNAAEVKIILQKLDDNILLGKDKVKELIEKEINVHRSPRRSKKESKIPEKPFAEVKLIGKADEKVTEKAKEKVAEKAEEKVAEKAEEKVAEKAEEKVTKSDTMKDTEISETKMDSAEEKVDETIDKSAEITEKETENKVEKEFKPELEKDEKEEKDNEKKDEESSKDLDKTEDKTKDEEPAVRMKLKDFSLVLSCIEGTPEKLLQEIYYLLFLEKDKQEIEEIKEKILEFDGFPFDDKSDEYNSRKEALNGMNENMVKDITRALYLDPKMDKLDTELRLLEFLSHPKESLLRPTVIAPGMLADCDIDFDGLSDSDDSIICEVVEKKVECVDLLSSGEEDDAPPPTTTSNTDASTTNTITTSTIKQTTRTPSTAAQLQHQAAIAQLQAQNAAKRVHITQTPQLTLTSSPSSSSTTTTTTEPIATSESSSSGTIRTLRDFVTIKKIVETHPNEYLVDIYNLLYMQNCQQLENLRKDILDFTGFDFDKTSAEYTKRKLFLDRMLYNSVRRIYNTLIHNTREVKVFSKPTMIGEIFQFLLKLPDHDTSIPPPRPAPVVKTYSNYANVSNIIANQGLSGKEQSGKLSDLKRVFQRVACFPCEYLVDVHKLLFMTDCEMKDIRANIFAFKGFDFAVGSPEFNQRKMFLEYLTFHSLRKISSVLTTKTVDMRNSTKHELASHLTEVLKEYTTLKLEEDVSPKPLMENKEPQNSIDDGTVEQIVVTPILPSIQTITSHCSDGDGTVSSSTSENSVKTGSKGGYSTPENKRAPRKGVDSPRTDSPSSSTPAIKTEPQPRPQLAKRTAKEPPEKKRKMQIESSKSSSPSLKEQQNMQFADINLPDIEKYRQIYKSNLNISMLSNPSTTVSSGPEIDLSSINAPTSTTLNFQPEFMYQQVGASLPMMNPNMGATITPLMSPNVQLPIINSLQQQIPFQNSTFIVQSPSYINANSDVTIPVECVLQEGKPGPKRFKQMVSKPADKSSEDISFPSHVKEENENPSSSIQLKIRDAMIKTGDDEEDCDKPLATLVGHPNDKVLKQQICEIVENTDLQDISMNGVIQKIFNMYPKYDLNYRKEFIKSTLRSLLYQLGEQDAKKDKISKVSSHDVDSSVTASKRKTASRQS